MNLAKLDRIAIVGVGLLGGSIGHAVRAAGFRGVRIGIGRRSESLDKALKRDAVDEVTLDAAKGVRGAQLVIVCTPISQMEAMFRQMAPALRRGAFVTDVGSTKAHVVKLAQRLLPAHAKFVGSHPMAGSEKTSVEYARADLFERALCIVTPTAKTAPATVRWMRQFWESIGAMTTVMDVHQHDAALAQVSHLPHAVASALVHLADRGENAAGGRTIDVAGPGFADVTRIASGDADLWTDIFRTNKDAVIDAVDRLMAELKQLRKRLANDDAESLRAWLAAGKQARDEWIAHRYRKKVVSS